MAPLWSSGIPVLNDKGEVIGISARSVADEQNPNFIIPANYLKTLLTGSEPARPLSQGKPLVSAEAYFRWGYTKSELGQYESAIADYDMVIQLRSDYAVAYNDRGGVKDKLGEYDAAIVDYDKAIDLKSNYAIAYYNRGNAKTNLGRVSEAAQDFQTALTLAEQTGDEGLKAMISSPMEIHVG